MSDALYVIGELMLVFSLSNIVCRLPSDTPAVQIHHGDINVVQQLGVELDRIARGHEDNDLLV